MKPSIFFLLCFMVLMSACNDDFAPKPVGYYRIDFKEPTYYVLTRESCPYSFDIPKASLIDSTTNKNAPLCWLNVHYPQFSATLHLSYLSLKANNLSKCVEDARQMAYKHVVKAKSIDELMIAMPEKKVYGMAYDFSGSTATNFQFYLTDSTQHFFRGALYFNIPPNPDSLAPVEEYLKEDIGRLIASFNWN